MATKSTEFNRTGSQLKMADEKVSQLFHKFLAHGHFKFTITGTVEKGRKRSVVISAGEEFKYTIPFDEIPRKYLVKDGS